MRIVRSKQEIGSVEPGGVLTIGNFDGVHLGHQEIIKAARQLAMRRQVAMVLMTFEPHPVAVLHPEKAPKVLTPLDWKLHLLGRLSPDTVVVLEDSRGLLELSAHDFLDRFLMRAIRPSVIVEGEDFKFGAGRSGGIETLRDLGATMGFRVEVIPSRYVTLPSGQALRVSSTAIRRMLEAGAVADAALALGRPFRLYGRIVVGRGKGRKIGFPTLNMGVPDQILPAEGVYAGWVQTADSCDGLFSDAESMPGVFSLGRASTFGDTHAMLIEAHVLSGPVRDKPGGWMAMDLVQQLRPQHRFPAVDDLARQIARDCQDARVVLERAG
jgi:riboflavin kinase / FMN adenylyltransferase